MLTQSQGQAAGATGVTANWTQEYSYDRYGNKLSTTANGVTENSAAVPRDGLSSLSYTASSNRISTSGYQYDNAGNLTKGEASDGGWQRHEYDAAGRLVFVRRGSDGYIQQANEYAATRERLASWSYDSLDITYYAWGGQNVIGEYTTQFGVSSLTWRKNYVYAGSRLLSTQTANGSGGEIQEFHHPDRLGTKIITDGTTKYEQSTLPFGTYLQAESTATNPTNQIFTSYDRSGAAKGLDYAVNRSYTSGQSRFTSVDPIGMSAAEMGNPQSNNLYAYVENQPIDFVDPAGLNETSFIFCEPDRWDPNTGTFYIGRCYQYIGGSGGGMGIPTPVTPRGPDPGDVGVGPTPQETNCQAFARIVDYFAGRASTDASFIDTIFKEFQNQNDPRGFASTGFRNEFVEPVGSGNSPNQVRHAAGAITAGFAGALFYNGAKTAASIATAGVLGLLAIPSNIGRDTALNLTLNSFNEYNDRSYEYKHEIVEGRPITTRSPLPLSQSQIIDRRLNGAGVPIGFMLGNGEINRHQVGNSIRRNICN